MPRRFVILVAGASLLASGALLSCREEPQAGAPAATASAPDTAQDSAGEPQTLSDSAFAAVTQPRSGDFDSMLARRQVRMLVVPSRTHYFVDRGTPRGLSVDAAALFEAYLNKKYRTGTKKIHVALVPVRHDEVIPALLAGRGDIAAAALTVTPESRKVVDFSIPIVSDASEIVVTGPASPPLSSIDDLAGKEVFVRRSSPTGKTSRRSTPAFSAVASRRSGSGRHPRHCRTRTGSKCSARGWSSSS